VGSFVSTTPFPDYGTRTLAQCEEAIHVSHLMAGQAFKEIRDRRLYSTTYGSGGFERYCQERFHYSKRHVNRLIKAFELCEEQRANMGPMVPNFGERHYRELSKLKTRSHRTAAVIEIQSRFGVAPTTEQVREVVEELLGEKRKPKAAFHDEKPITAEAWVSGENEVTQGFSL
jgi:hypothetical protein